MVAARSVGWMIAGWLCGFLVLGCDGVSSQRWQTASGERLSAEEILERVRQRYAASSTYGDRGAVILRYELQGAPQEERHPFSVVFRRPDADDVLWFRGRLNRRGETQAVAIFDPETNNVDGQVLMRDGVDFLSTLQLPNDPILNYFVSGQADVPLKKRGDLQDWFYPLPLALSQSRSAQPWFEGEKEVLDEAFIDGAKCLRIQVAHDLGRIVVWIDPQEWLVRRVELPEKLLDDQVLKSASLARAELVLEFFDAGWDVAADEERLAWRPRPDAHLVKRFVSLPEPFPSELIGRQAGAFELAQANHTAVPGDHWSGQVTALVWASSDPACRPALTQLAEVARRWQGQAGVELAAVMTDPPSSVNRAQLEQTFSDWGLTRLGWYRDAKQVGKTVFGIDLLPTLVVMGPDHKIQFFKVVDEGDLATELQAVLTRLQQGDEIGDEMRREYANYLKLYERQLVEASWGEPQPVAARQASFKPLRLPKGFGVREVWNQDEVESPGNLAVIQREGRSQLAVLEGFQRLAWLDDQGRVTGRVRLGDSALDSYTQLHSYDANGSSIWVASSVLGKRVAWIEAGAAPRSWDVPGAALVRDVLLVPAETGTVPDLLIGFWEGQGIECWNRDGTVLARSTEIANVASLAQTPTSDDGRSLVVGTAREGGMFRVELDLSATERVTLEGVQASNVFTGAATQRGQAGLCVLGVNDEGQIEAVGYDLAWNEVFRQPLSEEVFEHQIQFVQEGPFEGQRLWALARPDGTIHLVTSDGERRSAFQTGVDVRGLALYEKDGATHLVIASPQGLTCWELSSQQVTAERAETTQLK